MLEETLSKYDISSLDLSLQVYLAMEEGPSRAKTLQSIFGKGKPKSTIHDTYENCPTLSKFARKDLNRTMSPHESLCTSMLRHLNRTTVSKIDLEEAFCRDIDSFNAAFIVSFNHFNQSPKIRLSRQMMDRDQKIALRFQPMCVLCSMTAPHALEDGT